MSYKNFICRVTKHQTVEHPVMTFPINKKSILNCSLLESSHFLKGEIRIRDVTNEGELVGIN